MPHFGRWLLIALTAMILFLQGGAQSINSAIELRAGKTLLPGDYAAVRFQQPTNYDFQFSAKAFAERSRRNGLNYAGIGLDVLVEYPFEIFRIGIGPTIHYESEPWVLRESSFSQRLNYGICAEGGAELFLTDVFAITAFANQKYLFNKSLGQTSFVFGLGLKYSFGN